MNAEQTNAVFRAIAVGFGLKFPGGRPEPLNCRPRRDRPKPMRPGEFLRSLMVP